MINKETPNSSLLSEIKSNIIILMTINSMDLSDKGLSLTNESRSKSNYNNQG